MKSKHILKILIPLLLIGVVVLLLSTAQLTPNEEMSAMKIGVVIYRSDDTFVGNMMDSLRRISSEYEQETGVRINLNIVDSQESQSLQNDQVGRLLSLGYDVLCVNLVDRTDAARIITHAMNADIPVVFFNREPVQSDLKKWDQLYYVGADARESAIMQASVIIDAYRADPNSIDFNHDGIIQYIMIEGESRHQDTVIRTEVSVQSLRDGGMQLEKLDGGIANWNRNQASALAEQYFTQYGDQIELMICNNDDMALGVADAIERMGLEFSNIVGIDATPQGREAVDEGKLLGTVSIGYEGQAQAIFDIASALVLGTDVGAKHEIREDRSVRVPQYVYVQGDGEK
ncbi:MAG: galactose ABC transporter substrate-binding protein [Eubacteriales bacterium]|nr:galactose ABC transporter substrate-binding protein [Eubacteriales bacterium]